MDKSQEHQPPRVAPPPPPPQLPHNRLQRHLARCRLEVQTAPFWRDVACEAIATFFLLSVQSSVVLSWGEPGTSTPPALAMACVVSVLIEVFGPVGGAHMNPAVSIAFVVSGKMTLLRALIYIPIQCCAGILGSGLIYWLTPPKFRENLAATTVHPDLTVWQGLVAEVWVTSLLIFTVHASENSARRPVFMPAIIIGFAVLVGGSSGAMYSGASLNPARALGPAVVMNIWAHHWIYWVGPISGALLATVLYCHVFDRIGLPSTENNVTDDNYALHVGAKPSICDSGCQDNDGFIFAKEAVATSTVHM